EFKDIRLAASVVPYAAYLMFEEGMGSADVAKAMRGVGPDIAKSLERQWNSNRPVDRATTATTREPSTEEKPVSDNVFRRVGPYSTQMSSASGITTVPGTQRTFRMSPTTPSVSGSRSYSPMTSSTNGKGGASAPLSSRTCTKCGETKPETTQH